MIWFNRTQLLQTKWDPYFIAIVINDVIDQRSEKNYQYPFYFYDTECIRLGFCLHDASCINITIVSHSSFLWLRPGCWSPPMSPIFGSFFTPNCWLALTSIWKLPSRWTWVSWSHSSQDVVNVEDHGGDSQKEEFAAQPLGPRACVPREQFWKETNRWEWKYEMQMTPKWFLYWATQCVVAGWIFTFPRKIGRRWWW